MFGPVNVWWEAIVYLQGDHGRSLMVPTIGTVLS